jgi:hypothetical protein
MDSALPLATQLLAKGQFLVLIYFLGVNSWSAR